MNENDELTMMANAITTIHMIESKRFNYPTTSYADSVGTYSTIENTTSEFIRIRHNVIKHLAKIVKDNNR